MAGTGGTSFAPAHGDIRVDLRDEDGNVALGSIDTSVTSLPTGAGYARGCILRDRDASSTEPAYQNDGTSTVASFIAL